MVACLLLSLRRSNSRRNFICEEQDKDKNVDASIERTGGGGGDEDLYSLSIPKKLIRSVSLKLRKTNLRIDQESEGSIDEEGGIDTEQGKERWVANKCLGLYGKSVHYQVGAEMMGDEMVAESNGTRKVVGDIAIENPDEESECRRESRVCSNLNADNLDLTSHSRIIIHKNIGMLDILLYYPLIRISIFTL